MKYADGDKLFEKPIVLKRTELKNPKNAGDAPGK